MNDAAGRLRQRHPEETVGTTDLRMADGVFAKTIALSHAGLVVPQHAHAFPHVSVLVRGKIRAWAGSKVLGDFEAPVGITIAAHVKHRFLTLTDDVIILCVHDIGTAENVEIEEEHQLEGVG